MPSPFWASSHTALPRSPAPSQYRTTTMLQVTVPSTSTRHGHSQVLFVSVDTGLRNEAWLDIHSTKSAEFKNFTHSHSQERPNSPNTPPHSLRRRLKELGNLAAASLVQSWAAERARFGTPTRRNALRSRARPELLVKSPSWEGSADNPNQTLREQEDPAPSPPRLTLAGASHSGRSSRASHLAIVADKHHAVAGVNRARTEITLLNPHVETAWGPTAQTPIFKWKWRSWVTGSDSLQYPTRKKRASFFPEGPGMLSECDGATQRPGKQQRCRLAQAQSCKIGLMTLAFREWNVLLFFLSWLPRRLVPKTSYPITSAFTHILYGLCFIPGWLHPLGRL